MELIEKQMQRLLASAVVEFPTECYIELKQMLQEGGLRGLIENKVAALSCLFSIAAWALGKLAKDNPVIGASIPGEVLSQNEEDNVRSLAAVFEKESPIVVPAAHGPIRNAILKQILAMAVSHLLAILEDSDKVQEYFELVLEWIKKNLR